MRFALNLRGKRTNLTDMISGPFVVFHVSLIALRVLAFSCADLAQTRRVVLARHVKVSHVLHQIKMRLERLIALRAAVNAVASYDALVSAFHVHLKYRN